MLGSWLQLPERANQSTSDCKKDDDNYHRPYIRDTASHFEIRKICCNSSSGPLSQIHTFSFPHMVVLDTLILGRTSSVLKLSASPTTLVTVAPGMTSTRLARGPLWMHDDRIGHVLDDIQEEARLKRRPFVEPDPNYVLKIKEDFQRKKQRCSFACLCRLFDIDVRI